MAKMKITPLTKESNLHAPNKENIHKGAEIATPDKEERKTKKNVLKEQARALKEATRQERDLKRVQEEMKKKEKEEKKQQEEAQKEEKRKEREMKRQQVDAEKEQRRQAREAAEKKQQLVLLKQASMMKRFLRPKETETPPQEQRSELPQNVSDQSSLAGCANPVHEEIIARMDVELTGTKDLNADMIFRSHTASWREQRKARTYESFHRWGLRRKPKTALYSELRLQGAGPESVQKSSATKSISSCGTPLLKRTRLEFEEDLDREEIGISNDEDLMAPPRKKLCNRPWKLLQFDKSHRPAYYGTFSKQSSTIGPRCPLKKDPSLDYDVDSDEEWEEEDPGESLSDCEDKEDDLDKIDNEGDEDSADGFVVPDGYLSDSEGVHLEDPGCEDAEALESLCNTQLISRSPSESLIPGKENENHTFQRLVKLLDDATIHALQRNRPLLVTAYLHKSKGAKGGLPVNRTERLCLQALSMRTVAPDLVIDLPEAVTINTDIKKTLKQVKKYKRKEAPLQAASTAIVA